MTALVVAAATLATSALIVGMIAFIPRSWRRRLAWFSPWPRASCAREHRQ